MMVHQVKRYVKICRVVLLIGIAGFYSSAVQAEYGDVVINNFSQEHEMRPVVFPHWFHRIRFRCSVCHEQLGFIMKKEANMIDMSKIANGQYCGACHNGDIAWAPIYCERCHSGQEKAVVNK